MPLKKSLFTIPYDNLQDLIDIDDSRGRSVPVNMNFIEEGFLTKDTGFSYLSSEDTDLRHSLFNFKKTNGESYILSMSGTKIQSYHNKYLFTAATSDVCTSAGHGLVDTDQVNVFTNDTLPAGLAVDTIYFVRDVTTDTFKLSLTEGGTAVNITNTGSGEQRIQKIVAEWDNLPGTYEEDAEWAYSTYDDELFMSNGVDDYMKFNGSSFTTYSSAPKGTSLAVFEDRMFVCGVASAPGTYFYSNIGDAETFDSGDIVKPLGTDPAQTMRNYYGTLLLFKKESIWKLTFQYNQVVALFVPKLVIQSNNYGAASKDSVRWVENDIWFFTGREVRAIGFVDNQSGVFGVNKAVISESIKETLLLLKTENFSKVKTFYTNRRYYLSIQLGSTSTQNDINFVCHLLYGNKWTKYTERMKAKANSFMQIDDSIYTTTSSAPFRTILWDDSLRDDAETAINSEVLFQRIEDRMFNRFRIYRYLDMKFKDLIANVEINIKTEANDRTSSLVKTTYIGNAVEGFENSLGEVPPGQMLVADSFGELVETSPFIKKRISFLSRSQAYIIGLKNNGLGETFTICAFNLMGYEEPRKQFSGRKIISIRK